MSIVNSTLKRSVRSSQPFKGLLFIAVIAAVSAVFEVVFGQILRLDVNLKFVYITI